MPDETPSRGPAPRTPPLPPPAAAPLSASEAQSLMQAIVATATEGIVSIDTNSRIETVNRATERLFGYGPGELIGQHVTVLMPSPYREEHDDYLQRYLTTGQARIIGVGREVQGRRQDGSVFPIDLSVGEGLVGNRRFFVAIIRDVTDRKEMQAKLALAERLTAIGELAAGVAHEINNPINTILNCAQLITDGDPPTENVDTIAREGRRVAAIVRDLLSFARDDRDPPRAILLAEVIQRTVRLLQRNLESSGITLHLHNSADLPPVLARPPQLQQVLLNLLLNAKDALVQGRATGRAIVVATEVDHGGVTIIVRDNGPGVPAQLGSRIFEPFVTTKRGRGGTGLGLSITKNIVEGLGGSITLHSEPGHGAEFRVWLPVGPETAPWAASDPE